MAFSLDGDVLFGNGCAVLTADGQAEVARGATELRQAGEVSAEVVGYTDVIGNANSNMRLSLRRAETARALLVANGIAAEHIDARGAGSNQPIAHQESSRTAQIACLQPNCRVDITATAR